MTLTNRRAKLRAACVACLAGSQFLRADAVFGSTLDCQTPGSNTSVYGQLDWYAMSGDLNASNGGPLAISPDMTHLTTMLNYTGLWVDVRQPPDGTLTGTEIANLQTYIATGRRVVLIGGPGPQAGNQNSSLWNNSLLTAVGGPTGSTFFSSAATPALATSPVSAGLSAIDVPAGAVSSSGISLFADAVATVWGPARNAILLLDSSTVSDDDIAKDSDTAFASNLAEWVTGGKTDGACSWQSSSGGGWQSAANWPIYLPSVADDAVFNLSSPGYVVSVPAAFTARNLIVQNDHVTIDLSGESANLTMAQGISIAPTTSSSSLSFTHSNGGTPVAVAATVLSIGSSAGAGTLNLSAGVQLNLSGATNISSGSSLNVNGGTLTTTALNGSAVSISSGSIHIASAASAGTLNTIHSLAISGNGTLDLANTDLDLQSASLTTITAEIRAGYANGTWAGTDITSSAAAKDPTHLTALGVIVNNNGDGQAVYGSNTALGLFDGTNPGINDVLIKYTYFGDANLDGHVDGSDYTRIDNGFNNHLTGWINGDFNYDGNVDGSDYSLIDNAFNTQSASLSVLLASTADRIDGNNSVPEPAGSVLAGIAVVALRRRSSPKSVTSRKRGV